MTGTEIYKRTATYDRDSRNIRLHAPQWKLLLAFDGQKTLSEVAQAVGTSLPEALPSTQKFLAQNWIEEEPITLEQYLKRTAAPEIATPAVPSSSAAATAAEHPHTPPPLPAAKAVTPQTTFVGPVPGQMATPKLPAATRPMRLSSVVDFITSLVGNLSVGQLLVYRVFLRVPPELLLSEDVASVHLNGDTSIIKGEKLQKAISEAVNAVTSRALPDSVFAPA